MPINEFYLTKSELKNEFDTKTKPTAPTSVFQFNPMNNKLSEKTNKLSSSILSGTNSNVFYSKSSNESPSGGRTIKINTNNSGNKFSPSIRQDKFRSENLNKTSISDKHISKILHTTSSKDSGKILKRTNDKSKKLSAFSVVQVSGLFSSSFYSS